MCGSQRAALAIRSLPLAQTASAKWPLFTFVQPIRPGFPPLLAVAQPIPDCVANLSLPLARSLAPSTLAP